jgi:hypothetical protein
LTVYCTPKCNNVLDMGQPLGPSPVYRRKIGVGPHRVTLQWGSGKTKAFTPIVIADKEAIVNASWP